MKMFERYLEKDIDPAVFGFALAGIVVLFAALVAIVPLALIWALNTLFGLGIPYNLWTWLAAAFLLLMIPSALGSRIAAWGRDE